MNDRIHFLYSGADRAASTLPQSPEASNYEALQNNTALQESETKCPPTIGEGEEGKEEGGQGELGTSLFTEGMPLAGLDMRSGLVGLHGIEWLRHRVKDASRFHQCALVLGEMLRRSIELKADHVTLSREWLSGILGDETRRTVLPLLLRIDAIERAGSESPWYHRITRKYRFTAQYSAQPLGTISLAQKLIKRHREHLKARLKSALAAAPIYRILWDDIQFVSLHSSWEKALPRFTPGDWRKQLAWRRSYDEISHRNFRFSCTPSKTGKFLKPGRLSTTFSSTPSTMRQYALLDGIPLVCIDVKASQPFLHSTLIPDSEEKRRYLESVKSGTFYEDLGHAGNWRGSSRDELKEAVFAEVFYGRTLPPEKASPMWTVFRNTYPTLAEAIAYEKRARYQDLSIKMQYLEAEIILHTALPLLKKGDPSIRVLTVHDAIYVAENHVPAAREALETAFIELTGNSPEFSVIMSPLI